MAEASTVQSRRANFVSLPFDVHVYIVKLLNLNEALTYAKITPEANSAVQYVFAHRKQLDFGSVLGPNGQILLSDEDLIQVLHAHIRVETITDFSLQPSFTAFTALREYMESHWIPMDNEYPRKSYGYLCNLRYPTHTHFGAATPKQGRKLYYEIWQSFNDEYGVFTTDYSNWNTILPLNNAPGNWATQELREPDTMSEVSSTAPEIVDSDLDD